MKKLTIAALFGSILAAGPALANDGKQVYSSSCIACHGTGAAGSPKTGDSAAWAPRVEKGMDVLVKHAIEGLPGTAMLPRGTCNSCSDDDLKAAVEYMVEQSQ